MGNDAIGARLANPPQSPKGRWTARWVSIIVLVFGLVILIWTMIDTRDRLDLVDRRLSSGQSQNNYVAKTTEELQALEEFDVADRDSWHIISAVAACYGVPKPDSISGFSRIFFDLPPISDPSIKQIPSLPLNGLDMSVLSLNVNLKIDRWRTYRNSLTAQSSANIWQILIIATGAFATLFVAVKATDKDNKLAWAGYIALALSGASTALTSWSAFISPAAVAAASQQRLASLQGMHQKLLQSVEKFYTRPLCPSPRSPVTPIPGEPLPKSPSEWSRAYTRALDEVSSLRAEYVASLQIKGVVQGSESGKPPSVK